MGKLNIPMDEFMEDLVDIGVTQHFTIVYGDAKKRIKYLAKLLHFEYYDLDERHALRHIAEK